MNFKDKLIKELLDLHDKINSLRTEILEYNLEMEEEKLMYSQLEIMESLETILIKRISYYMNNSEVELIP